MTIKLLKITPDRYTAVTLLCSSCYTMNSESESYAIMKLPFRYICQKCACTESGKKYQIMEKPELPQ